MKARVVARDAEAQTLTLRYTDLRGEVHERKASVDARTWRTHPERAQLLLTYPADAPEAALLPGESRAGALAIVLLGCGVIACALGATLLVRPS